MLKEGWEECKVVETYPEFRFSNFDEGLLRWLKELFSDPPRQHENPTSR